MRDRLSCTSDQRVNPSYGGVRGGDRDRHLGVGAAVGGASGVGHPAYPEGEREGEGHREEELRGNWLGVLA